ncbi:MAG TPA: hypothetical protein VIC25_03160, partial [Caulobacteraceae bacterium]
MRSQWLGFVCALTLWGPVRAQSTGPDASMAAQTGPARAMRQVEISRTGVRGPDEPGETARPRGPEGARPDADCDKAGGAPTASTAAGGVEATRSDPRAERAACRALADTDIALAPINEVRSVTHHQAIIGGRELAYTATAGTLTLRDNDGKPIASMFYVAYTAGEGRGSSRPVTFFYNGGPGSSTLWLHMGSLSPVRVATDSPEATHNAPFQLVDNNDSLLDRSDLVFLDAIGAGFSRPLGDTKLAAFWGTDADIDAFARGIERYLTLNDRW